MINDGNADGERVSPLRRRTFLKTTGGVAGAGLIAGCSVGDGGGDGGDGGGDGGDGGDGGGGGGDGGDGGGDGGDGGGDGGDGGDGGGSGPDYPQQDIRFIIPFGPGGGYDFYSRLIAKHLPKHLPNEVNVQPQNVEGAGGQIATDQVWAADDDPYVHWIINMVNFSLTQLTEDVEWDLREFSFYAQVAEEFRGVAVGSNTDIETWDDYVTAVQNNELNFASTGPGSGYVTVPGVIGDIGGLYPAENVMDNQVIYDGRGEAVQGILAGDAHVMSGSYFSILPYAESDDVRMVMACTTEDEAPEHTPDAATLATAGVDNAQAIVDMLATRRIYAGPPNVDDDIVQINVDAYMEALTEDEELLAEAEEADRPIVPAPGPDAQQATQGFIDNWSEREELLATLYGL